MTTLTPVPTPEDIIDAALESLDRDGLHKGSLESTTPGDRSACLVGHLLRGAERFTDERNPLRVAQTPGYPEARARLHAVCVERLVDVECRTSHDPELTSMVPHFNDTHCRDAAEAREVLKLARDAEDPR